MIVGDANDDGAIPMSPKRVRKVRGWLAAFACALAVLAAHAGTQGASATTDRDGWGRYRDRDLGMAFDFPAHIFPLRSAEQGRKGVVFSTADGRARIRVFAFTNEANDTPRRYLARIARPEEGRFTYVRTTPRFFVASGTREGMIFYRRCNFLRSADHRVSCFQLDYPRQEKRAWDGIVTRISLSLAAAD